MVALQSPPRAAVAFRVGIVGHRPNRLPQDPLLLDELRQTLHAVLANVRSAVFQLAEADAAARVSLYSRDTPVLRAISPLAEGTDRMFAEEAIDLGYQLLCPMPFHQEEFETDFEPPAALEEHSCQRFHELLGRARKAGGLITFELGGNRSAAAEAYDLAGRAVLNQSDLLVVVWDRGEPRGPGGTVQTLREAIYFHVPVFWINPYNPKEWRIVRSELDVSGGQARGAELPGEAKQSIAAEIGKIVASELMPSPPHPDEQQVTKLRAADYFAERRPRLNPWFAWKLFRDLVGDHRVTLPAILGKDFGDQIGSDWPLRDELEISSGPDSTAPSVVNNWINRRLREHHAWADKLADWYADHYRSGYLLIYTFSALAVLVAIVLHAVWYGPVLEFILVGSIIVLIYRGSKQHWHERWMEYRLLAELIRQIQVLLPLGGGRPLPRTTPLSVYENLTQTWMYWHMRAIARAAGVPQTRITAAYLLECLRYMADIVGVSGGGQLRFHQVTSRRSEAIAFFLHSAARDLFLLSFWFVLIHILAHVAARLDVTDLAIDRMTLVLAALPALGGAVALSCFRSYAVFFTLAVLMFAGVLISRLVFSVSVLEVFLFFAALPAFGAAFTSIANQGEFVRLAKRSVAMASAFEQFAGRIKELERKLGTQGATAADHFVDVVSLVTEITQVMVDEVSDWRVIVAEQPMRLS